jgi:hypothetical protein
MDPDVWSSFMGDKVDEDDEVSEEEYETEEFEEVVVAEEVGNDFERSCKRTLNKKSFRLCHPVESITRLEKFSSPRVKFHHQVVD